jgi:hypothetical protein
MGGPHKPGKVDNCSGLDAWSSVVLFDCIGPLRDSIAHNTQRKDRLPKVFRERLQLELFGFGFTIATKRRISRNGITRPLSAGTLLHVHVYDAGKTKNLTGRRGLKRNYPLVRDG